MPDSSPEHTNGWNEWSRHVLAELTRQNNCISTLEARVTALQIAMETRISALQTATESRIAALQLATETNLAELKIEFRIKAGIWGLAAGIIPAIGAILYVLATRK